MIHEAYIRKFYDADGVLVATEMANWHEIPKFVIRTRTYSLRWVWVKAADEYGAFTASQIPQEALFFLDFEEARRVRRRIKMTNPGLLFRLAVRVGGKKV